MAWKVELSPAADKDLNKLDRQWATRILTFLNTRIATGEDPRAIGEALTGERFGEFWKYRVGDYRIVAKIEDGLLRVLVVRIGHRREIYR
jgi:mRNA interferase RelE/StbE